MREIALSSLKLNHMKKLLGGLLLIPLLAFITNPSDETCMEQMKDGTGSKLATSRNGLRIEDNYLYKDIYIKGTDTKIGIGFFGMVIETN